MTQSSMGRYDRKWRNWVTAKTRRRKNNAFRLRESEREQENSLTFAQLNMMLLSDGFLDI